MNTGTAAREQPAIDFLPIYNPTHTADALIKADYAILDYLEQGRRLKTKDLRSIMTEHFGDSDATGARSFKLAYEACAIAQILFLRKYSRALLMRCNNPAYFLTHIHKVQALLQSQILRSEGSIDLQQFSTPLDLALAMGLAAQMRIKDIVLEPSSSTGMLMSVFNKVASPLTARISIRQSLMTACFQIYNWKALFMPVKPIATSFLDIGCLTRIKNNYCQPLMKRHRLDNCAKVINWVTSSSVAAYFLINVKFSYFLSVAPSRH